MKSIPTRFAAVLLLLGVLCGNAIAQEAPLYRFEFYVLGWDASATNLKYQNNGRLAPIVVTPNLLTGPYSYSGNAPMQFVSQQTGAEGQPQLNLEAQLQLSSSPSQPLLVVFTKGTADSPLPYRVLGINDAIQPDRTNEVTMINFSSAHVGGKLNDATFTATPGTVQQVKVVPGKNLNVSLRLARQNENGWEHAFSTIWGENPRTQSLVFVIADPRRPDQISVKRLQLNRHLSVDKNALADQSFADPFAAGNQQRITR